ncbi:hypothetical protein [Thauera sinica]|uniref:Uncharacterized protein n=1 Tax=Thauera sinica TaxID=2665146 RepID=A0ABW1AV29_9RHOO|nr:hypothetical protein [Thauera sp. K11]
MQEYVMQKEELAKAALKLREVLHVAREDFLKRGYPGSAECVDYALELLNPILDLCISNELEEPFDFFGYMVRNMRDQFWIPYDDPHWRRLCDLGRGGLTHKDFLESNFAKQKIMPKQLRIPQKVEYQPGESQQERVKRELKFKEK